MRKYPKYKASGYHWYGEVPKEWEVKDLKHELKFQTGGTPSTKDSRFYEGENTWVTIGDMNGTVVTESSSLITNEGIKAANIPLTPKGSLLYSFKLSVGQVAFAGKDFYTNEAIASFLPSSKYEINFWFYALPFSLIHYANENIYGAKLLNQELIKNACLIVPPKEEQHAIVRFLDYKTGQIDSFIANRQKQIELLKEQKAGIINKAVTKGINPNAKMKDSGIEWIGEVPEHWMIGKVRRVLNILTDFTANGSFADLAKNVKYLDTPDHSRLIRLTDLREDLKNEGIYVNKEAHKFLSKSELFGGEILMANVGAYAGLVCLVPKLDFIATLGPNMFLLKFDEKRMSNQFAFTLLGSDCYYKLLMNKALSSAQPKLNKEDVKSIDFIFPPKQEEQKAILDWIKEETSNVDTLISKYQKQIDLMQEYRTSLISQSVTGKIDVREWEPKKQKAV